MKITFDTHLQNFEFWSGAKTFAEKLTLEELNELEYTICDLFPDKQPTETEINDLFWFEDEMLCELIGIDCEDVYNRQK